MIQVTLSHRQLPWQKWEFLETVGYCLTPTIIFFTWCSLSSLSCRERVKEIIRSEETNWGEDFKPTIATNSKPLIFQLLCLETTYSFLYNPVRMCINFSDIS